MSKGRWKKEREYYLNEQAKAIQKELGESDEQSEIDEYENKINKVKLSKEAKTKAISELKKLKSMSPMSANQQLLEIIWMFYLVFLGDTTKRLLSIWKHRRNILDADHSGLEKVKERIIEHLAVQSE